MKKETIFPSEIETDRLILRNIIPKDIEFIYEHFSDPHVYQYLVDEEPVTSKDEASEIVKWASNLEDISYHRWLIQLKKNDEPIGTCGFHKWDRQNNRIEIGYDLTKSYWRKGITFEALDIMMQLGFERMNLNRIEAFVHLENIASYNLLNKLGFHLEGIVRDKHLFRGQYYDHYCFSLLKSDLK